MAYGPNVPYQRARKILPVLERWLDLIYPPDASEDLVIDFRNDSKPGLKEVRNQLRRQLLRDKLIAPESAFLIRADMGLHHLLCTLGVRINVSEIQRRVAAAPAASREK